MALSLLSPLDNPLAGLRPLGASYSPDPLTDVPLTPEEEATLTQQLLRRTMGGLETVGYALDTPGALLRGLLAGRPGDRVSGRDLLTSWGLTSANDPNRWELADIAGLGADIAFDPLTYLTFGGGALTKAGKFAKAAGVGADDIAKIAAKQAGEQIGKKIGQRQARMMLSYDDLVKGLQETGNERLLNQLASTADTMGVNAADLGSQKLGSLIGYDIPFSGLFTKDGLSGALTGTGAKSQAVAGALDATGAALAASWPGRKLTEMFDPAAQGAATAPAQRAMREMTAEKSLAEQDIRGRAREHLDAIEGALQTQFPDLNASQRNEVYRLIAEHNPEAQGPLGDVLQRFGYQQPGEDVVGRVGQMKSELQNFDDQLAQLSLPTPKWLSEVGTGWFHRSKNAAAFGEATPGPRVVGNQVRPEKGFDTTTDTHITRDKQLDIEGGTVAVDRLTMDPELSGPNATLKDNAARANRVLEKNPATAHLLTQPVQTTLDDFGEVVPATPETAMTGAEALRNAQNKQAWQQWKPQNKVDEQIQRTANSEEGINAGILKEYVQREADKINSEVDFAQGGYSELLKNRLPSHVWKAIKDGKIEDPAQLDHLGFDTLADEMWNAGLLPSDAPDHMGGVSGALLDLMRTNGSPSAATKPGGALAMASIRDPNFIDSVLKRDYANIKADSTQVSKFTPDEESLLKSYERADRFAKYLKTVHPSRAAMSDPEKGITAGLFDQHLVSDWERAATQTNSAVLAAKGIIQALADAAEPAPRAGATLQLTGPNNALEWLGFGRELVDPDTGKLIEGEKDVSGAASLFHDALKAMGKDPSHVNIPVNVVQDLAKLRQGVESAPWLDLFDQITRFTKSMLTFSPAFHGRNLTSGQLQNLFTGAYDAVNHPKQTLRAVRDSWAMARGQETKYLHTIPIVQKELGKVSEEQARNYLIDLAVRYNVVDPSIAETVGKEASGIAQVNTGLKVLPKQGSDGEVVYNALEKRSELTSGAGRKDPFTQTETRRGARTTGYDTNVLTSLIPDPTINQMFGGADALSRYLGTNPFLTTGRVRDAVKDVGKEYKQGVQDVAGPLLKGQFKQAGSAFAEGPLNPLNIAGLRGEVSRSAGQRAHERISQNVELFNRMGGFLGWLQQGVHPAEAAARVRASQVDYKALSPFEKSVMRRTVPFYAFNRRMADFVANDLMERPGGGISQAIQATNTGRTDDSYVPDYVGEGAAIPLGAGSYITGLGLMHEGPLNTFALGAGPGETINRTAQKLGAQLNPLLKAPIEAATKTNLFTGRPLNEIYQHPIVGATSTTAQLTNAALMNSPLSRMIAITRKLEDPRKDVPEKLLNMLTGINVSTLSGGVERAKEMEARKALEELLKSTPNVKSMENIYIKAEDLAKLSPQEQQAYAMYKLMKQRAKDVAKKKKTDAAKSGA